MLASPAVRQRAPHLGIALPDRSTEKEMPVAIDGELEIRKIMNLSLSCDHRVVDGWDAANFMQALKALVENPLELLSMR